MCKNKSDGLDGTPFVIGIISLVRAHPQSLTPLVFASFRFPFTSFPCPNSLVFPFPHPFLSCSASCFASCSASASTAQAVPRRAHRVVLGLHGPVRPRRHQQRSRQVRPACPPPTPPPPHPLCLIPQPQPHPRPLCLIPRSRSPALTSSSPILVARQAGPAHFGAAGRGDQLPGLPRRVLQVQRRAALRHRGPHPGVCVQPVQTLGVHTSRARRRELGVAHIAFFPPTPRCNKISIVRSRFMMPYKRDGVSMLPSATSTPTQKAIAFAQSVSAAHRSRGRLATQAPFTPEPAFGIARTTPEPAFGIARATRHPFTPEHAFGIAPSPCAPV